jgi:hypothetical protein
MATHQTRSGLERSVEEERGGFAAALKRDVVARPEEEWR